MDRRFLRLGVYIFMIYALSVIISAVAISLTAAYFSVIGLATMFPGSQTSVIIMGFVLEVGKLMGAVWLHQNWESIGRSLRYYLLISVLVLMGITSMGIFGYLSKAHIEHATLMGQEYSKVEEIDQKITRLNEGISRQQRKVDQINSKSTTQSTNKSAIVSTLQERITQINKELDSKIATENDVILKLDASLKSLDEARNVIVESGGFGKSSKLKAINDAQAEERARIKNSKSDALARIQDHQNTTSIEVGELRDRIDVLQKEDPKDGELPSTEPFYEVIDGLHEEISGLKLEKIEYEKQIKLIESEVGPIKYISQLMEDFGGSSMAVDKMIRLVIIVFIFVFDPLAVILLIAGTVSYVKYKKNELPPDVQAIRNKLLEELEDYLSEGGLAEHFIDRAKKD